MSGLAEILISKGYTVSGSDINHSDSVKYLQSLGLKFYNGHFAENIDGADTVVYTAAVSEENPELKAARAAGARVIPRSVLLGEIMAHYKYSVAVAGTHGKTTTTSMISYIFEKLGFDPTILVGARLDIIDSNMKLGKSDYFIAEACEYHRSFLDFKPYCETILNVEPDHLDYYKDADDYHSAYTEFLKRVSKDGFTVVCADDADLMKMVENFNGSVITYGISNKTARIQAKNISATEKTSSYDLYIDGAFICKVELSVFGKHNIENSLAALANAYMFGFDLEKAARALAGFKGADRRFEYKGTFAGASVYDDYAHHPTEIRATLESALMMPHNNIICVFQPHTYSRTKIFLDEFAHSFKGTTKLILAPIYAAREAFDPSISSSDVCALAIKDGIDAVCIDDFDEIAKYVKSIAKEGDVILIIGAGDIVKLTDKILG
ncbi:MAG: UDP-N-acetylmuramate--L-alanine ligase [Clostridia bacterium]|nr:UDP-N-acetylmuramate--L-alanine ligase [Clostridia bacterium]